MLGLPQHCNAFSTGRNVYMRPRLVRIYWATNQIIPYPSMGCETRRLTMTGWRKTQVTTMPQEITALEARKNELKESHDLTNKQAAILAAFDDDPTASYSEIASRASEILGEGESVTGSYSAEQIKQRRPEFFDDEGERVSPDETGGSDTAVDQQEVPMQGPKQVEEEIEESRVATLADWYGVTEEEARAMAKTEVVEGIEFTGHEEDEVTVAEPAEAVEVGLTENDWLRLMAYLHLFADTDAGAPHEERVMDLAGEITRQAL